MIQIKTQQLNRNDQHSMFLIEYLLSPSQWILSTTQPHFDSNPLLLLTIVTTCLAGILGIGLGVLALTSPRPIPPLEEERWYRDIHTDRPSPFPTRPSEGSGEATPRTGKERERGDHTVNLTVVIPAYNEGGRIPVMLHETLDYLLARAEGASGRGKGWTFEVIVVDDGSKDDTSQVAWTIAREEYASRLKKVRADVRVLKGVQNRGKGGAVLLGMRMARGNYVLFADADGATRFSDVEKLEVALASVNALSPTAHGMAVGSRAHMVKTEAVVKRSFIRNFLMKGFHTLLSVMGISSIGDTQCGFKMVTRRTCGALVDNMHVQGWIFDIEMLLIGMSLGIPIQEVPVDWHEIEGTKLNLIQDSIRMAVDVFVIRLHYLLGWWRVRERV